MESRAEPLLLLGFLMSCGCEQRILMSRRWLHSDTWCRHLNNVAIKLCTQTYHSVVLHLIEVMGDAFLLLANSALCNAQRGIVVYRRLSCIFDVERKANLNNKPLKQLLPTVNVQEKAGDLLRDSCQLT